MAKLAEQREQTTVYRLYNADNDLLYVGIARDFMRRIAQHAKDKSWWAEVTRAFFEHYDTRAKAAARERQLIAMFKPPHNVMLKRAGHILTGSAPAEHSPCLNCERPAARPRCEACRKYYRIHGEERPLHGVRGKTSGTVRGMKRLE